MTKDKERIEQLEKLKILFKRYYGSKAMLLDQTSQKRDVIDMQSEFIYLAQSTISSMTLVFLSKYLQMNYSTVYARFVKYIQIINLGDQLGIIINSKLLLMYRMYRIIQFLQLSEIDIILPQLFSLTRSDMELSGILIAGAKSNKQNIINKMKNLKQAFQYANEKQGFTYSLNNTEVPKSGFIVSIQGKEKKFDQHYLKNKELFDSVLKDYISENSEKLTKPSVFLGCWIEGTTKDIYFDCSVIFKNKKRAIEFGKANSQLAFFDLKNKEVISL